MEKRRDKFGNMSGSLLVMTLWLITVLSLVAISLAGYLSTETRLARYHMGRAQARAWARAGVYMAMQKLAEDAAQKEETADWLQDDWSESWIAQLPVDAHERSPRDGRVTVKITDEESRLDLNSEAASPEVVGELLASPEIGAAVVDYRDPADPGEDRPEASPPYAAKNAPIAALEELSGIPVLREQPEALAVLQTVATVYTQGRLNVNTAVPEVLNALKGGVVPVGTVRLFTEQRGAGPDRRVGTTDDCLLTGNPDSVQQIANCLAVSFEEASTLVSGLAYQSDVFRIVAEGEVPARAARCRIEAVVRRKAGTSTAAVKVSGVPFEILAWREG